MKIDNLKEKLKEYHTQLGVPIFDYTSPIAGSHFSGEFNVSGFHKEVQDLANSEKSFWGIDKCLRLKDKIDDSHSFLFNMGIFATSINLRGDFKEPFKDKRFIQFQEEIINQFIQLIKSLGINIKELEATYLGEVTFGNSKGRDKALLKEYTFPEDKISRVILEKIGVKCYPISSIANIDIHPHDDALVGLRIEIAYNGIEIATIVFDCFKIKEGKLTPINYIGGYAIGIERLLCALSESRDFLSCVPKYSESFSILTRDIPVAKSSLLREDVQMILFGAEVLASIREKEDLSKSQKELFRQFRKNFNQSSENIGLKRASIKKLIGFYDNENSRNRS